MNRVLLRAFLAFVGFLCCTDSLLHATGGPSIPGDYNNSGQVEQGDLDLVLQNWGVDTDVTGIPPRVE